MVRTGDKHWFEYRSVLVNRVKLRACTVWNRSKAQAEAQH